tara:strand:+ start:104244 stop:105329 length:1086 start_codon:yes stop_codon:yes gene_type:complete
VKTFKFFFWIPVFCLGLVVKGLREDPLYFELPFQINETFERSKIGELMEEGFIAPISIQLSTDSGRPLFYESNIRTTVCDDEICEIMYIRLYWDLVGEYVGYDTVSRHPLTKFDHEPFTENDYTRLHELLQNEGSILKFKQKSDLIDKEKVKASDVVDGTTGATALEIKEEVVEGALYSSYTLWHLAYNGQIKNMIITSTKKRLNKQLFKHLLDSDRSGYKLFAFHNFEENDFITYKNYWLTSLKEDMPLTRKYILKNIPDGQWENHHVQDEVCAMFNLYDVNTRTYLLNKIEKTVEISNVSIEYVSTSLTDMNRNQVKQFISLLSGKRNLTSKTMSNVNSASKDKNFKYSYLVDEYNFDD